MRRSAEESNTSGSIKLSHNQTTPFLADEIKRSYQCTHAKLCSFPDVVTVCCTCRVTCRRPAVGGQLQLVTPS